MHLHRGDRPYSGLPHWSGATVQLLLRHLRPGCRLRPLSLGAGAPLLLNACNAHTPSFTLPVVCTPDLYTPASACIAIPPHCFYAIVCLLETGLCKPPLCTCLSQNQSSAMCWGEFKGLRCAASQSNPPHCSAEHGHAIKARSLLYFHVLDSEPIFGHFKVTATCCRPTPPSLSSNRTWTRHQSWEPSSTTPCARTRASLWQASLHFT